MKRFQQALQEDGAYNSVSFSYDYNTPEVPSQYPQTTSAYENMQSGKCSLSRFHIGTSFYIFLCHLVVNHITSGITSNVPLTPV